MTYRFLILLVYVLAVQSMFGNSTNNLKPSNKSEITNFVYLSSETSQNVLFQIVEETAEDESDFLKGERLLNYKFKIAKLPEPRQKNKNFTPYRKKIAEFLLDSNFRPPNIG